jgi:hypothetical protein
VDLASLEPERLVFLFTFEFTDCGVEWWSSALEFVDAARENMSPRYDSYLGFLRDYLPEDTNSITGFALAGLTVPQQALQLFVLDIFADQSIVAHDTSESWLEVWQSIMPFAAAAFDIMVARPELIRLPETSAAWAQLRAAVS